MNLQQNSSAFSRSALLGAALTLMTWSLHAATTDIPTAWSNITLVDYLVNGQPVRDADGDAGTDGSEGGAGVNPARADISSGATSAANASPANCNPPIPSGSCGTATSVFWGGYDGGTPFTGSQCTNPSQPGYDPSFLNDYLAFRLRVNRNPGTNGGLASSHWNVLLDIDGDGFKEFWVDIDGTFAGGNAADRVNVYYSNANSNRIADLAAARRDVFTACNQTTTTGTCRTSHTRVTAVNDGTGEYFIDVQVPLTAFRDAAGVQQICPSTPFTLFFSTSASNTNPLQKDFSQPCPGANMTPEQPCDFGDTTPVTVRRVSSVRKQSGYEVSWTTTNEVGHAGFEIYAASLGQALEPAGAGSLITAEKRNRGHGGEYRAWLPDTTTHYFLVDRDVTGRKTTHGPYLAGQVYGATADSEPIDWASIGRETRQHAARRHKLARQAGAAGKKKADSGETLAELVVDQSGVVRVTFEDLAAAGWSAPLSSGDLALVGPQGATPIWVSSSKNFGPGDWFEFVAEVKETLYAEQTLYRLLSDRSQARRITSDSSRPQTAKLPTTWYPHTENFGSQSQYSFAAPGTDPWFDTALLTTGSPGEWHFTLQHDSVATEGGNATLRAEVWGATNWPAAPDHHVVLAYEGEAVDSQTFDGQAAVTLQARLPLDQLADSGSNAISLRLPSDLGLPFELVHLDQYSLTYPRRFVARSDRLAFTASGRWFPLRGFSGAPSVYRISGQQVRRIAPERIDDGWAVAGESRSAEYVIAGPAGRINARVSPPYPIQSYLWGDLDLMIISHPQFLRAAEEYAALRSAQGVATAVADVESLYRTHGTGVADAAAIQNWIRDYASDHRLGAVLLAGGDTYDYLGHAGSGSISFVPTLYAQTDEFIHFSPVDAAFGDLDGDRVPDLPVGRWPVRTAAEMDSVVEKSLLIASLSGSRHAVFAADTNTGPGQFDVNSDFLATLLPEDWSLSRFYLSELSTGIARQGLIDAMNDGPSLVSYFGHSSFDIWSFSGLLTSTDVLGLTNAAPFAVTQQGCWNTYYVEADANTMGHAFLVSGSSGAALVMGASTLANARHEMDLARLLIPELLARPVGEALIRAKQDLAIQRPDAMDMLLGFNLLGDPTLRLASD